MVRLAQRTIRARAVLPAIRASERAMATKKSKAKSKAAPAKGMVGLLKRIVTGKPTAKSSRGGVKKAAKPPVKRKGKTVAAPVATQAANGKSSPAQTPPIKKKPPSITITRPEATRPPVVVPPPRVLEAPIGAPSILEPKVGPTAVSLTPILRWMYVGGATRYEVEWSPDSHFGRGHSSVMVSMQTAITLEPPHELKPGTNYKWRVRGGNDAGWGPWSPPESFRSAEK